MSRLMRTVVPALCCAVLGFAAATAQAEQRLVLTQSEIDFTSKQMGVPVDGKFKKFDAQVAFDPKKPDAAKIAIDIDLASVSIGAPEPEAELVKPDWFATKQYPQASFRSTSVKSIAPGRFEVAGKLTIKGASRDVVVPVALAQAGGATTANGGFVIKRLDFKIGDGDWKDTSMVANDVQVRFKFVLTGVPAL